MEWTSPSSTHEGLGDIFFATIDPVRDMDGNAVGYGVALYATIPATRWEPADYEQIDGRLFATLENAKRWAEAREARALADEILADIEIDEAVIPA